MCPSVNSQQLPWLKSLRLALGPMQNNPAPLRNLTPNIAMFQTQCHCLTSATVRCPAHFTITLQLIHYSSKPLMTEYQSMHLLPCQQTKGKKMSTKSLSWSKGLTTHLSNTAVVPKAWPFGPGTQRVPVRLAKPRALLWPTFHNAALENMVKGATTHLSPRANQMNWAQCYAQHVKTSSNLKLVAFVTSSC